MQNYRIMIGRFDAVGTEFCLAEFTDPELNILPIQLYLAEAEDEVKTRRV
jgi:hypothetical protein